MMVVSCALGTVAPKVLAVLFLGNSHTSSYDVPGMVRALLLSDGTRREVKVESRSASFLEDFATMPSVTQLIRGRAWDAVVMQGAKLSSSHKYDYPHDGAVKIARMARDSGAKALLFAEWPRRGWNETEYILKEYREISTPSGATLMPVCRTWDKVRAARPNLELWSSDGNHANQAGAYVAACHLYFELFGKSGSPNWRLGSMAQGDAAFLCGVARRTVGH